MSPRRGDAPSVLYLTKERLSLSKARMPVLMSFTDCSHSVNLAMQHTSLPGASRHKSHSPSHSFNLPFAPSDPSSGFITVSNSWTSNATSLPMSSGPERLPLAWSGVRHEVPEKDEVPNALQLRERSSSE